jgi:hypothetical protein
VRRYLIYRVGGGFNSILAGILGHLHIADKDGMTPVVDMESFPGTYSERDAIFGTKNMWEYYFLPIRQAMEVDIRGKDEVIDSGGGFPTWVMDTLFHGTPWLPSVYKKYVCLRDESVIALEAARQISGVSRDILGVHFRGTDMRTAPYHPMPPSIKQIFSSVDSVLEASSFRELFVVSEHEDYVAKFVKRYGSSKVATLDVARSSRKAGDIYKTHPRLNHRYLLGLEALIETYLLAECGGLVSGFSGVSEMANVLSNGAYVVSKKIWNGRVPGSPIKARTAWSIRSKLPRSLGGFYT